MDIYNKNWLRNIQKRASYENLFEIRNIIDNFNNKFNFGISKDNSIIEPYINKNINIYYINNNLNKILFNGKKQFNSISNNKIYCFKRKRKKIISNSYFDKIKNLYSLKPPILLSGKKKEKLINNNSNAMDNKKTKNNHYFYLPKISSDRKDLISHIINKKLNYISLENTELNNFSNKYNFNNNKNIKQKLPRVKSTIVCNNNNLQYNRLFSQNKRHIRCNSSISNPNLGVKSIYMSFGLKPKKEQNNNFFSKKILLRNFHKRNINSEENRIIRNNIFSKRLNHYLVEDFKKINKDKTVEKGKEYKFNQKFKKVIFNNLNNENDNMLLNDKGTLIGPFFNNA